MIDIEDIQAAYDDILGAGTEEGLTLDEIVDRFDMLGIDWGDFRRFLVGRVKSLEELGINRNEEWASGYIYAAMEWFLYGNMTGKIAAMNNDLDEFH